MLSQLRLAVDVYVLSQCVSLSLSLSLSHTQTYTLLHQHNVLNG